jgi:hypothetical protein
MEIWCGLPLLQPLRVPAHGVFGAQRCAVDSQLPLMVTSAIFGSKPRKNRKFRRSLLPHRARVHAVPAISSTVVSPHFALSNSTTTTPAGTATLNSAHLPLFTLCCCFFNEPFMSHPPNFTVHIRETWKGSTAQRPSFIAKPHHNLRRLFEVCIHFLLKGLNNLW